MHLEARVAPARADDPVSQMAGLMLAQMFPAGGLDQFIITGEKGTRAEQRQAFADVQAGTVTLVRPDGSMVMLDPATKTFWRVAKEPLQPAAGSARATVSKRGEFEMIDGLRAEHLTISMPMTIPGMATGARTAAAPGVVVTLDAWMSDAVKGSSSGGSLLSSMLARFGMGGVRELNDGRHMVKGVLTMFGVEIVMTAGHPATESVAADLFDVPKDFKEISSPIR
jgi:hypothetical protein